MRALAQMPLPYGRAGLQPRRIIVHAMAEFIPQPQRDYFAVDWLAKLELSVHALVTPSAVVIRCREDNELAWHAKAVAGDDVNADALGIEYLVPGLHTYQSFARAIARPWVGEEQYAAGLLALREWMARFPIAPEAVQRHSDIDPERKIDPGYGFPWERLLSDLSRIGMPKIDAAD